MKFIIFISFFIFLCHSFGYTRMYAMAKRKEGDKVPKCCRQKKKQLNRIVNAHCYSNIHNHATWIIFCCLFRLSEKKKSLIEKMSKKDFTFFVPFASSQSTKQQWAFHHLIKTKVNCFHSIARSPSLYHFDIFFVCIFPSRFVCCARISLKTTLHKNTARHNHIATSETFRFRLNLHINKQVKKTIHYRYFEAS